MPNLSVLLLGDAHRLRYQQRVKELLAEDGLRAEWPADSTGNCGACLDGIGGWIEAHRPDIVCFSCGPHAAEEAHVLRDREPVSVSEFEAQLLRISEACRRWCGRQVAFVTTPPIHPGRFAAAWNGRSSGMGRAGGALLNGGLAHDHSSASDAAFSLNRAITQYNQGAMNLLSELNIMVIRLHDALEPYLDECIAEDGVSLSPAGVERAAAVVATGILGVV